MLYWNKPDKEHGGEQSKLDIKNKLDFLIKLRVSHILSNYNSCQVVCFKATV